MKHHLKELGKPIEFYSKTNENIIMGDLKSEISEPNLASFCTFYNFKSLISVTAYLSGFILDEFA